jgi:ferredoxin-NADP reductase
MKNYNKNKAEVCWVDRLFKQSGSSLATPSSKTYFAYRYHKKANDLDLGSFGALFSGIDKERQPKKLESAFYQELFAHETSRSKNDAADDIRPVQNNQDAVSQYRVLNCYSETPDTKTFRLSRLNGDVFDYLPGQYVTLFILIGGHEYSRSYSLASYPGGNKVLEITVKRSATGGVVSNWLNDHLKIGDTLNLKGPFGKFSSAQHPANNLLFLAAGSGIVPIMSMLRWLAQTESPVDIQLLLSFRTPEAIIYRDELQLIAARHNNIHLAITITSDDNSSGWPGLTGRVNKKMLADLVPDLPERSVYLCGPNAFMAGCVEVLSKLRLPLAQLYCESFTVNKSPVKQEISRFTGAPLGKKGSFRIGFAKSGQKITDDGVSSLLELAEKSGISIAHDCRSGQCGECMIKCLKGRVEMTVQAEIGARDRKKGWVYACCAYPASHVLLDI